MMCLKNVLIFLILLPFPTAPPLFMFLFIASMFHKLRPCVYCTIVLVLIFLSTCNNNFLSLSFPRLSSTGDTLTTTPSGNNNDTLIYSAPAERCWCDLNAGRLLWPVLKGYTLVDKKKADARKAREKREGSESQPEEEKEQHQTESYYLSEEQDSMGEDFEWMGSAMEEEVEPSHTEEPEPVEEEEPIALSTESMSQEATPKSVPTASKWSFLPWYLRSPRSGQVLTPNPTDAASPRVPQPPSSSPPSTIPLESSFSSTSKHWYSAFMPAKTRWDLRYQGIGFVLDFGLGRSETAVKQEVEEWIQWNDYKQSLVDSERARKLEKAAAEARATFARNWELMEERYRELEPEIWESGKDRILDHRRLMVALERKVLKETDLMKLEPTVLAQIRGGAKMEETATEVVTETVMVTETASAVDGEQERPVEETDNAAASESTGFFGRMFGKSSAAEL